LWLNYYLWACNRKFSVSLALFQAHAISVAPKNVLQAMKSWVGPGDEATVSLFRGLFCTCKIQKLGIIIWKLEKNYRLIFGE